MNEAAARLTRSEARALRALVKAAIPMYALQVWRLDPRLTKGLINLDMERLARRGLVAGQRITRRFGFRWVFTATEAGRAWVAANPEPPAP